MKSTIALPDGSRLIITALHAAGAVCIEKLSSSHERIGSFHLPFDFAGAIAQAIERAGDVIEKGPYHRPIPAPATGRCTGNCNQGRNCTCAGTFAP